MMYLFFYFLKSSSKNLSVSFSAISLFETWCESQEEAQNSNDILLGYSFFYQYSEYRGGGGVSFCERIVLIME